MGDFTINKTTFRKGGCVDHHERAISNGAIIIRRSALNPKLRALTATLESTAAHFGTKDSRERELRDEQVEWVLPEKLEDPVEWTATGFLVNTTGRTGRIFVAETGHALALDVDYLEAFNANARGLRLFTNGNNPDGTSGTPFCNSPEKPVWGIMPILPDLNDDEEAALAVLVERMTAEEEEGEEEEKAA